MAFVPGACTGIGSATGATEAGAHDALAHATDAADDSDREVGAHNAEDATREQDAAGTLPCDAEVDHVN